MLIILDSNIWITFALNSQLYYITDLKKNGIILGSCKELRDEIATVLSRPKFNKIFSELQIISQPLKRI
jgi:predicted nucleic acid-binding protein